MWDLSVYHDRDGTVRVLAAHWWLEPEIQSPLYDSFETANMDPFKLTGMGVFRKTAALKELEIMNAQGSPPQAMVIRRRTAVLQNVLEQRSALIVRSRQLGEQLSHPVYPTGAFHEYQVGAWAAASYHAPPAPVAGDYGTLYIVVHRSLLKSFEQNEQVLGERN